MATAFTDSTEQLADGFPQDKSLWHAAAPRRLTALRAQNSSGRRWKVWQQHLGRRKQPAAPQFLSGKTPPILWAWPTAWQRDALASALASLVEAQPAIDLEQGLPEELPTALRAVALAYALPELANHLSPTEWWKLAEALRAMAIDAAQLRVHWESDPLDALRQQLLAGELPLALGYLFPELRPLRTLRKPARQALSEAIVELTDGKGMPHARLLPVFGPLLACWTRCRWLGERLKQGCWSGAAEIQYQWLVRRALQIMDSERRLVFADSDQEAEVLPKQLLAAALELAGDASDYAAAAALCPAVVPHNAAFDPEALPKPSLNSEWAGVTVMSGGWSSRAARLAVSYADDPMQIELTVAGRQLLSGNWTTRTTCDGELIPAVGPWEELIWQSDVDSDYLELVIELADGLRIERQVLFAREDQVLYLADNLSTGSSEARALTHAIHLPLAPGMAWLPEAETRDGLLSDSQPRAAVIPPALLEWRSDPRGGSLVCQGDQLVLSQATSGRALCCPLFFDLRQRRIKKERTWRQLTVAESLAVVPRDLAVGFRMQSGRDQWLVYRSLGRYGNRTLLGQNISSEFYAGRFLKTGEVDEWVEIEPSDR
jgi:hypothetical protein